MRFILVVCLILTLITRVSGQQKFAEFPGTGFGLVLPDTSFHYRDRGFVSTKLRAALFLMNMEEEPDASNFRYGKMVEMMFKDLTVPGSTILLDKTVVADSGRIVKTRIAYDTTDAHPAGKGEVGIAWLYFYKYKGSPVVVVGSYEGSGDSILSDLYFSSLKTFGVVDSTRARSYFKNQFAITNDYAPLKYCGEAFGGTLLNMEGKYDITGPDSSYCIIVPINLPFPSLSSRDARDYMRKRVELKGMTDVRVDGPSITYGKAMRLYSVTATGKNQKTIFFAIAADELGYFEIWGEANRGNAELVKVFRKIADSLTRH